MKPAFRTIAALALAAAWAVPGLAADPVRIGVGIARTGPIAPAAAPQLQAYELWVDQVNAAGGLDVKGEKRPVELVVYDDQSNFANEAGIYEKLITDDKVDLLLSPHSTPAHFAIVGVLERYGFPVVGSTAASVQLKELEPGNIWFPTSAFADTMAPEFAKLLKAQGVKTVGLAMQQSPFPQEVAKYFRPALEEAGIEIVADEEYAMSAKDLTSVVSAIKAAQPDAAVILDLPPDGVLYMRAAREQGLDVPYQFMLLGPSADFFKKMFGPALDGMMTIGHWTPYKAEWPRAMPFFEAYTARFGEEPDYLDVALSWMSVEILQQAVAQAGLDHDALREAISSMTFDTINGPVRFEGVENVETPVMFLQIQDGKTQVVWPEAEASAPVAKISAPAD
ncbi:amino acid ABC transporter substrate-binding protein [Oceanicella sp. SM1341]|uniref:amino acid ABC transporter substrate-binding protein n=1 Tax=Oceanicella sp. SM1341 TaxID=1548889 RepID=UPI000E4DE162|nr:amino acid ABC transporter substrate-binding protein [Oceanicella sp. SM1341]